MSQPDPGAVLFLGFVLPDHEFEALLRSDTGMPVQTQRFGWSVVGALLSAGLHVHAVSAAPASDYPRNTRLVFRGSEFAEHGTTGSVVSFVNITGLKHVTRYLAASRAVRRAMRLHRPSAILVHGAHSPFIWIGVRVARRHGIPVAVILTDPPSLTAAHDSPVTSMMKRLDHSLILRGLKSASGVIGLTDSLADDFAPGVPFLRMEGIARPLDHQPRDAPGREEAQTRPTRVLYAGGLWEEYGVRALVDAVSLSAGDWELSIYGRGPMESEISERCAAEPRVHYGGLATTSELAEAYSTADLLINPRPIDAPFARHSFPSKLLEYLVSGRAVMSTRLPGIPEDYESHVLWTDDTPQALADSIDAAVSAGPVQLAAYGRAGREFALQTKGRTAQGARIRDFLRSL